MFITGNNDNLHDLKDYTMTTTDKDEARQHKQRVTAVFDTIAPGYDHAALRFFSIAADRVLRLLNPAPGQKVLDVATGTGAVATAFAQAVAPGGRVMAIDLSEAMLEKAMAKALHQGLSNIDFFNMDADQLDFKDDYFDLGVCAFGLFFLPDMEKALNEWVRVIRPGGNVVFTSFSNESFKPMADLFVDQLEAYGVEMKNPPFASQRLADPQICQQLMSSAGLKDISVGIHQVGYHLQCIDDWWAVVWNSGMRGLVKQLKDFQQNDFKAEHLQSVQPMFGKQGLWLNVEVLVSQGKVAD